MPSDRGISILIPVYNFDVRPLAQKLNDMASKIHIPVEIRVYDDGSDQEWTFVWQDLKKLPLVHFHSKEINIGRSAIRQALMHDAVYAYILFLDADTLPVQEDFLEKYVDSLTLNAAQGGTWYHKEPPTDRDLKLHWKMGFYREMKSSVQRAVHPLKGGGLNNLLIQKQLAQAVYLPPLPYAYGYEDALFVEALIQNNINVTQLENPVYHLGLNSAPQLLLKTKEAMFNACYAWKKWNRLTHITVHQVYIKAISIIPKNVWFLVCKTVFPLAFWGAKHHAWLWCVDLCKLYWYTSADLHFETKAKHLPNEA